MPRSGLRAVRKYSDEFKLTAVRLSQQPGLQVKTVATAVEIPPDGSHLVMLQPVDNNRQATLVLNFAKEVRSKMAAAKR